MNSNVINMLLRNVLEKSFFKMEIVNLVFVVLILLFIVYIYNQKKLFLRCDNYQLVDVYSMKFRVKFNFYQIEGGFVYEYQFIICVWEIN